MKLAGQIAILAVIAAGCCEDPNQGYTLRSQYRADIESVAVPIWTRGKDVYRRGVEIRLSEALQKRIALDTPYKITTKARADTMLTGTIDYIEQRVLSLNPDLGRARELELTISVSFKWTDLRNGKTIAEKSNVRAVGAYVPPDLFDEDFFIGSEEVINLLAKRIVEQMEKDW